VPRYLRERNRSLGKGETVTFELDRTRMVRGSLKTIRTEFPSAQDAMASVLCEGRDTAATLYQLSEDGRPLMFLMLEADRAHLSLGPSEEQLCYLWTEGADGGPVDLGWHAFPPGLVGDVEPALAAAQFFCEEGRLDPRFSWKCEDE
jgi:hypothetical protein